MKSRGSRGPSADPTLAVGYLRVSTEEQALGPVAQHAAIERWARVNGVRMVAWFDDLGVSGGAAIEDRPGLLRAVAALEEFGAGHLVVAKRDRLARDVMIAAMVERLVQRVGARIVSADGNGNGDGPEAALMRSIIDAFGAYERALIRARTKSALAVMRARGERTSRHAPFGFGFSDDGRRLVPHVLEQAILARVRREHAAGTSLSEIARQLDADGVPSRGRRWYASSILTIVRAAGTSEHR